MKEFEGAGRFIDDSERTATHEDIEQLKSLVATVGIVLVVLWGIGVAILASLITHLK